MSVPMSGLSIRFYLLAFNSEVCVRSSDTASVPRVEIGEESAREYTLAGEAFSFTTNCCTKSSLFFPHCFSTSDSLFVSNLLMLRSIS